MPRDPGDLAARHALQHEEIEADRRRDLRHLDDQHDEDAEPQQIDAGLLHGGQDDAHRQHDHRDAIQETAEDDVEHHQRDDEPQLREAETTDPLREATRESDVAHR